MSADGSGDVESLFTAEGLVWRSDWSADEQFLAYAMSVVRH